MKSLYQLSLTITLTNDLVISAHGGSAAEHHCLDYIPGANLMGIAAARFYNTSTPRDQVMDWFQSDRLRFGNGYYLGANGQPVEPTPLSLYYAKATGKPIDNDCLQGNSLIDLSYQPLPQDGQQYKCLDSINIEWETGKRCDPPQGLDQKSAIDPKTAMSAEGMLFHYTYLKAGAKFQAVVGFCCDDPTQWQKYRAPLEQLAQHFKGQHRIGKGRLSQYGTVEITPGQWQAIEADTTPETVTQISLRLRADLAAFNAYQQPTFAPSPADLGLPEGHLANKHSFIATRRYSPYNSYYRSRDRERQVICRGSVLTFQFDKPQALGALKHQLAMGLGRYRRDGLGDASLEPPPLSRWNGESSAEPATPLRLQRLPGNATANQVTLQWLQQRSQHQTQEYHEVLNDLKALYSRVKAYNAQAYNAQEETAKIGPGRSQWALVMQLCKEASSREAVREKIENAIPENDADWKLSAPDLTGKPLSFREWLLNLVANQQYNLTDLALITKKAKEADIRGVKK